MTETERADAVVRDKARQWAWNLVALIALVLALAAAAGVTWDWRQRAESAERAAVSFAQQVQEACAEGGLPVDGRDLCPRADEIVEDPAAPPVPEDGEDGRDAPPPTDEQVQGAVEALCSRTTCAVPPTMAQVVRAVTTLLASGEYDGEDGEDGQDALPPDPAELQAMAAQAVLGYCDAGPQCDAGEDGSDGPTVEEVQAMVAAEVARQIAGAVEDYCEAQPDGTCQGVAGVGVEKVECPDDEDDDWLWTFSDGTTQTVTGPCRVAPIIEPSPLE